MSELSAPSKEPYANSEYEVDYDSVREEGKPNPAMSAGQRYCLRFQYEKSLAQIGRSI